MRKKLKTIKRPYRWFKKTRKRNKIITVIVVVVLLLFVLPQVFFGNQKPNYEFETARNATITEVVSETGNVNASGRFDVYASSTGVIQELYVNNGTEVQSGQALFHVKSTATEQERASAYANYQSAVSALTTAEQSRLSTDAQMWQAHQALLNARNAVDYKNNNTTNPTTQDDYTELEEESIDAAAVQAEKSFAALERQVKEADVAINAAKAQVASALLAYQATHDIVVTAPTAGTVTNLSLSPGDSVTADTQGMSALTASPPPPVLTIANLNDYTIKLALNEVDIPKVRTGQSAKVTLDAFSEREFAGRVTHVDTVGTNTQGVVTYAIVITITNPDPAIRPGMTANVDLEVDKETDVLSVSNSAVKPYQGGRAVRVLDPETNEMKYIPVTIGLKGESRTQIVSGISEGQEVITALPNDQINRQGFF